MLHFQFHMPTRLVFGPGKLAELATTPHLPRGGKALVVIGRGGSMIRNRAVDRVQAYLSENGVQTMLYDKIRPNPESDQVEEAAAIARDRGVDFIVGLGGGSTVDSAKAIAVMATNPGSYWDYMHGGTGGGKTPENAPLPIVAIPTTAGTGTEADPWTVISKSEAEEKIGWGYDGTFPVLSIIDPELMRSVPPQVTAHTGMDAFFHAVECYLSTMRQPTSDMLALEAVQIIAAYLPIAVRDGEDLEARTALAWASTAAGICQSTSSCMSQHSMEHALSAFNPDLPHGLGLTLLSRDYFEPFLEAEPDRLADLAVAMDIETDAMPEPEKAEAFLGLLDALIHAVGLGAETLPKWGFTAEDAGPLADCCLDTMGALFDVTPVDMDREEVEAIFAAAIGRC